MGFPLVFQTGALWSAIGARELVESCHHRAVEQQTEQSLLQWQRRGTRQPPRWPRQTFACQCQDRPSFLSSFLLRYRCLKLKCFSKTCRDRSKFKLWETTDSCNWTTTRFLLTVALLGQVLFIPVSAFFLFFVFFFVLPKRDIAELLGFWAKQHTCMITQSASVSYMRRQPLEC